MSDNRSICWNCRKALTCPKAEAVETQACSDDEPRPKPPGPARPPDAETARRLWANTPKHLHPKPWTPTNQTERTQKAEQAVVSMANQLAGENIKVKRLNREIGLLQRDIADLRAKLEASEKREAELRREFCLVLDQVERDFAAAHAEIMRLQGVDPEKYTWPEWSTVANTLRWFKKMRAALAQPAKGEG